MNDEKFGLIRRTSVEDMSNHGINYVDYIDGDEPVLVAIGGDGTFDTKNANYYARRLKRTLLYGHVRGIEVYAPYFVVPSNDSGALRRDAFVRAGRRLNGNYDDYTGVVATKEHILFMYDKIIAPRIFDDNDKRFDINTAIERIRKLKLFGHCHGATIIQELAQIMNDKMLAGGYKPDEIKQIQSQLLVIQYAPIAPLEKNIFPTISFASSADGLMTGHTNFFADYMLRNAEKLPPAYFAEPYGNIFIGDRLKWNRIEEHDVDYIWETWNPLQSRFTDNGMIIYSAMRNALVRGAQHSLDGGKLPNVKALTDRQGVNFEQLRQNGHLIYDKMVNDLRNVKRRDK